MAAETTDETTAATEAAAKDDDAKKSPYAEFITQTKTTTTIRFRGQKFTFPRARAKWPTIAMQIFQRGNPDRIPDGVEMMLGAEQWERLNSVAPLIGDFWEFFPIFAESVGFVLMTDGAGKS